MTYGKIVNAIPMCVQTMENSLQDSIFHRKSSPPLKSSKPLSPSPTLWHTTIWRNAIVCCPYGEDESTAIFLNLTTEKVKKQWRILFKTQSFIANHLDHSNHQNPCLLLQRHGIHNPSNLYCLDSKMQVWELQKPPLLHYLKQGFGFSPIINGYKIVMTYASEYKVKLSGLKVYSLSSDSWKEVKFRLNDTACVRSQSVTVNGVMFWLGSKIVGEDTDDQMVIVSFGLAMEVLTLIPIPDP
ncbi:hypothetical protein K1719_001626 [Acacia pycnantha]|nr:hypothetical protein K1719_001626 [Acacia pycnantha]